MKLHWVKNEWSRGGFDNLLILGNKTGFGWTDKLIHFYGHMLFVLIIYLWLKPSIIWAMAASEIWGVGYEIFWDCRHKKSGVSKYDLVANNLGMLIAGLILFISQWIGRLQ